MKVRQHSFAELEASLSDLSGVYAAHEDLRRECRDSVIAAKDRARYASRNGRASELKRRIKAEMVEWMLVWLGDPALFADWARLRRGHMDAELLSQENANQPDEKKA